MRFEIVKNNIVIGFKPKAQRHAEFISAIHRQGMR